MNEPSSGSGVLTYLGKHMPKDLTELMNQTTCKAESWLKDAKKTAHKFEHLPQSKKTPKVDQLQESFESNTCELASENQAGCLQIYPVFYIQT